MEPKSDEEGREEKVRWSKAMKPETRISDHPNWPDSSLSSKIMSLNPRHLRENICQWPQKKKKEISITKDILYDWGDFNIGWNLDDTEFLFPSMAKSLGCAGQSWGKTDQTVKKLQAKMRKYVKIKDCMEGVRFMTKKSCTRQYTLLYCKLVRASSLRICNTAKLNMGPSVMLAPNKKC